MNEGIEPLGETLHGQSVEELERMVRSIASRLRRRFRLHVEFDDLVQLGMVGLLEAAKRFDPDSGVRLSSYAYTRVRGAMLDGVGEFTGVKRTQLRSLRRQAAANELVETLDHANAYGGGDIDIAGAVQGVLVACDISDTLAERNDAEPERTSPLRTTPERAASRAQLREILQAVLAQMPDDEAALLRGHYQEGRSLQALGDASGVSRSWMSRVHKRALERARKILRRDYNLTIAELAAVTYP